MLRAMIFPASRWPSLLCCAIVLGIGACATDEDDPLPGDPHDPAAYQTPECPTCYAWRPLRIGAGGWVTGLDISADGATRLVRTDTYGAYVWEGTRWRQLVGAGTMPSNEVGVEKHDGVYEISVAPGDSSRLYMSYRGSVFRSDDRGYRWTSTSFAPVTMDANDGYRMFGQKMAVDPANAGVVYVGTPEDGLFVTTDGGSIWQRVTAVPAGQEAGFTGIAFDSSGGTLGGRTRVVYAASYGNGVWRTLDAGASWAQLSGGPSTVKHAAVHADGSYYATANDGGGRVWRHGGGGWQEITPPVQNRDWHSVLLDPFNGSRIVLAGSGGYITQSLDGGGSWNDIVWDMTREAADIPWLAWTEELYMSNGDMRFDPVTPNKVWFAEGIGVWTTILPANPSSIVWTSQSLGIEQLVANDIVAPPGGQPVVSAWDRPLFHVEDPDVFPSRHGPNNANAIIMGWAVDYASTDPSFLAAIVNWWGLEESGYSIDGGRTWTRFPSSPPWAGSALGGIGGSIAASTPSNIVWVPSNSNSPASGKGPYFTLDGGVSWSRVVLPGVPDDVRGWGALHFAYYLNRHVVAADRVSPGTFYLYCHDYGVFKTTTGGSRWSQVYAGALDSGGASGAWNAKLKSVPDHPGHLFFTAGHQSGVEPLGSLIHSTDGGATWTAIPEVQEVYDFGFGKAAPGAGYPTLFVAGWVGGVYGLWLSENEGQSWVRIGDWPLGSLDEVRAIEGDKTVHGTVYVGFGGSGFVYGTPG